MQAGPGYEERGLALIKAGHTPVFDHSWHHRLLLRLLRRLGLCGHSVPGRYPVPIRVSSNERGWREFQGQRFCGEGKVIVTGRPRYPWTTLECTLRDVFRTAEAEWRTSRRDRFLPLFTFCLSVRALHFPEPSALHSFPWRRLWNSRRRLLLTIVYEMTLWKILFSVRVPA